MDCAEELSIEQSNYYENDKSSRLYEATCRFNNFFNRQWFDPFAVDAYYHMSFYVK